MIERGELVAAIKKRRLPKQQRQQPVASRPAGHPGRKVAPGFVQPMRCYNLDDIDDISTYLVMEKFDGVHVIWEPQNKTFRTMALSNNQYKPPPSFTDLLPSDLKLEGELWRPGRVEGHDHVSKCLHSKPPRWSGLQFMVFDAPPMTAQEVYTPYEQRLEKARSRLASGIGDCVRVAETFRCASLKDLMLQLDRYTEVGAEGLVLRKADSRFKPNIKDNNILKLKKWQDAEARVERWTLTESGKHWSMCCEDINGSPQRAKFQFGVYDVEAKPPGVEPGTIITYRCIGWNTNGRPQSAHFWRIRVDV